MKQLRNILGLITLPVIIMAEIQYSPRYQSCLDNSDGTTLAMRKCNANELQYQDRILNRNYKQAMRVLDARHRAELKKVQRQWIKYRDAKCDFIFGITGVIMGGSCYVDTTAQRAEELKDIINMM